MSRPYTIDLPSFAGPLDLLLHLIERQEFDITAISLVKVTDQYLEQIEQLKQNRIEQLIDFLVVAARLVQIKSRALLPQTPVIIEGEEEEDPAETLLRQLREYKRFKQAAQWLQAREEQGLRTYLRVAPPPKLEGRLDMSGVTVDSLLTAVRNALARVEDLEESVAIVQPRRITIEGQLGRLRQRAKQHSAFGFTDLLSATTSRLEISVTLLAVLELIKRQEILASQPALFGPIELRANPEYREPVETAVP
ncbi:segregation and condensation protein A [Candidatus Leptofilum sp.]|uniref:segregation and condensation protein A n=1 Tax=Candidatus Leptofilum sp. TaxID=3241576 RepID=UPI003B5CBA44